MKRIIYIITILLLIGSSVFAQKNKKVETSEFKVFGLCNMCKERIETAALIKGVKFAEWNKKTNTLKVVFKSKKTSLNAIHKSIAKAGHDTNLLKGNDNAYENLASCCKYRDHSNCQH